MPQGDAGAGFLVSVLILMTIALALTAFRVDAALSRGDGEKLFWISFTGLLTAVLALACAVAGSPSAAPWTGLTAVAGTAGAGTWVLARERQRRETRQQDAYRQRIASLEHRHDAVLRSWSSYELDEWKALEKPGLKDAGKPETKSLITAMKAAAALRPADGAAPDLGSSWLDRYDEAVAGLERAWKGAEAAAGGDGRVT